MNLPVVLTRGEDGWLVAECPILPGCISQGRTRDEALANIREAIEAWLETEQDKADQSGKSVDVELLNV